MCGLALVWLTPSACPRQSQPILAQAQPHPRSRRWLIAAIVIAVLAVIVVASPALLNEPLRRRIEAAMNAQMEGYTVQLPALSLHPWSLSLSLLGLTVRQNANPDPAVVELREMTAGVHWRALLSLRLVADLDVLSPRIHLDRRIVASESADTVPVQAKGWQDAIEAIYPLKFNEVRISDGAVTYIDDPRRPVELTHIEVVTTNIRNVRSESGTFPSPLHLRAVAFDSGRLVIDGDADYLATPNPAVKAAIELTAIPLARAAPVADDVNLKLEGGTLTAAGTFEAVSGRQHARLRTATIDGLKVDYVHAPRLEPSQRAEKVAKATADLAAEPGVARRRRGAASRQHDGRRRRHDDQAELPRVRRSGRHARPERVQPAVAGSRVGDGERTLHGLGPDRRVDLIRRQSARHGRERGHRDPRHRHDEDERSLPRPGQLRRRRR